MAVTYPQWLLFGDSITQHSFKPGGLAQSLADVYQRKMDIVNRGYGGYNSKWGLRIAPHIFPLKSAQKPLKLLSIWWGANDACLPMKTQSIPLDEFKDNLRKTVDMLRSPDSAHYSPDTVILLLSPPPLSLAQRKEDVAERLGPGTELDRTTERTAAFAAAVKEVAEERSLPYIPVFEALMELGGPSPDEGLRPYFTDGLHLTGAGYQVVFAAQNRVLQERHPELMPDNVPRIFPEWSDVDPNNLDATFPPA